MWRHVGAVGQPSLASVDNANNGIDRTDVAFRGVGIRTERSINFPKIRNVVVFATRSTYYLMWPLVYPISSPSFHCVSSDGREHYSIVHYDVEVCTTLPLYCEYFVQCSRNAKLLFNHFNNWTQREWRTSSKSNRVLWKASPGKLPIVIKMFVNCSVHSAECTTTQIGFLQTNQRVVP